MSIFAVENHSNEMEKSFAINKPQRLRLEIRRKQNDERFKTIRRQFVDSLKSLNFLQQLKSQKDNLTAKKINWLIEGLERGQNTASFYQDMMDMQLEPYLCDVILNQQVSLQNKTKILQSLVQLTYYSTKIPKQFLQNNMMDYFRVKVQNFSKTKSQIQQNFIIFLSKLIQNLTSFKNLEFNEYMLEYDLLKIFGKIIEQENYDKEFCLELGKVLLKVYKNIFWSGPRSMNTVMCALYHILSNNRNYQDQEIFCCLLRCLVEASKIQEFWAFLQTRTDENGEIFSEILNIVFIIEKNFNPSTFGYFIDFMNALYDTQQQIVIQQLKNYYPQFPPNFFLSSLKKLTEQETTESKRTHSKLVKLFSKMPVLQGTIYKTMIQKSELVQGIMQKYIMQNMVSRNYLTKTLIKLLDEDSCIIDLFIENGIVDIVRDLVSSEEKEEEAVYVIQLVDKLIYAEEELRDKVKEDNKMLNVFYDRGIIRDIEKMQDWKNYAVFRRAEIFMARVSQINQKN